MREHTARWCSMLTTDELNRLYADPLDVTPRDEPEDSGMVVVYVALAIVFLLILAGAAVLIASRTSGG